MAKTISTLRLCLLLMTATFTVAAETTSDAYRILVIGSTGTGKSTLINALIGEDRLDTNSNAEGCTSEYTVVEHTRFGTRYEFIDTVGLNDASPIKVDHQAALRMFMEFLWKNTAGFNLIIFCMREGRLTKESQKTYEIMVKNLYGAVEGSPPVLVIVGGNFDHHSEDPQKWCEENRHIFVEGGITEAQKHKDRLHCIALTKSNNPRTKPIFEEMRVANAKYAWNFIDQCISPEKIQFFSSLREFLDVCVSLWNSMIQTFEDWVGGDWCSSKVTMDDIKAILEVMGFDLVQLVTITKEDVLDSIYESIF